MVGLWGYSKKDWPTKEVGGLDTSTEMTSLSYYILPGNAEISRHISKTCFSTSPYRNTRVYRECLWVVPSSYQKFSERR